MPDDVKKQTVDCQSSDSFASTGNKKNPAGQETAFPDTIHSKCWTNLPEIKSLIISFPLLPLTCCKLVSLHLFYPCRNFNPAAGDNPA